MPRAGAGRVSGRARRQRTSHPCHQAGSASLESVMLGGMLTGSPCLTRMRMKTSSLDADDPPAHHVARVGRWRIQGSREYASQVFLIHVGVILEIDSDELHMVLATRRCLENEMMGLLFRLL